MVFELRQFPHSAHLQKLQYRIFLCHHQKQDRTEIDVYETWRGGRVFDFDRYSLMLYRFGLAIFGIFTIMYAIIMTIIYVCDIVGIGYYRWYMTIFGFPAVIIDGIWRYLGFSERIIDNV